VFEHWKALKLRRENPNDGNAQLNPNRNQNRRNPFQFANEEPDNLSHKSSIASIASILMNKGAKEETLPENNSSNKIKSLQNNSSKDTLSQRVARHDTNNNIIHHNSTNNENLRQNQHQSYHVPNVISNENNFMHQYKNSNQMQQGVHNNSDLDVTNKNVVHTQHAAQDNGYYSQQQQPNVNITAQQQAYLVQSPRAQQQQAEYMYNSNNQPNRDQNPLQAQHVQHVNQAQHNSQLRNSHQYPTSNHSNINQPSQADNEYFNEDRQQMMLMQSRMRNPNDNIYTTHPPYSES
jgi:hypothetical protein